MPANLTDKDIIDMIHYIAYLKQEIKLRDRALIKLRIEYEQFRKEVNNDSRNNIQ